MTLSSSWEPSEEYEYRAAWLKDRYSEYRRWQRLEDVSEATSIAVQRLTTALVEEQDYIDTGDLTALFRLCQHSGQIRVETKREAVDELAISESAKDEVQSHISEQIGSVGGPNFHLQLPNPEAETGFHNFLRRILETENPDQLDTVANELAELDIDGLQSGKLSPILHYLRPTYFPIINGLPVDGLKKYFDESISSSFDRYVSYAKTYRKIRDRYGFKLHCRDLDYFFVWAEQVENQWDHDWMWMLDEDGSSTRGVYAIQPGYNHGSGVDEREYLWPAWRENDFISVSGEDGDIRTLSEEDLEKKGAAHNWDATTAWKTFMEMSPGDIVVAKWGTNDLVGIGVVEPESYSYEVDGPGYLPTEDGETTHPHLRSVDWVLTDADGWHQSDIGLSTGFDRPTTYHYGYFEELRYKLASIIENGVSVFEELEAISRDFTGEPATQIDGPTPDSSVLAASSLPEANIEPEALLDGLYFQDANRLVNRIRAALRSGKHIVFTGAPGTGKTEVAENVCRALLELEKSPFTDYKLTTATADWTTFDTVGGRMPESDSDRLVFSPGFILQRFKQDDQQQNDLLVIDELNRADIDKAFGQLFTLLSGQAIQLPFEKDGESIEVIPGARFRGTNPEVHEYVVPETWRLITTMNSYDKASLYEMSYAFMRRFAFINIDLPDLSRVDAAKQAIDFMTPYLAVWFDLESESLDESALEADAAAPDPADVRAVVTVWQRLSTGEHTRPVGPALVKDMLEYMMSHDSNLSARLVDALVAYVFPQLEGVPDRSDIVSNLAKLDQTGAEADRLRSAAETMLDASFVQEISERP